MGVLDVLCMIWTQSIEASLLSQGRCVFDRGYLHRIASSVRKFEHLLRCGHSLWQTVVGRHGQARDARGISRG